MPGQSFAMLICTCPTFELAILFQFKSNTLCISYATYTTCKTGRGWNYYLYTFSILNIYMLIIKTTVTRHTSNWLKKRLKGITLTKNLTKMLTTNKSTFKQRHVESLRSE